VEITEQGPARARFEWCIASGIRVYSGYQPDARRAGVDVAMKLDWYERATFLKAGFPVNAQSSKVSAEIPYASSSATRPATKPSWGNGLISRAPTTA